MDEGRYNGVIVTHGSDTIAYTSAYLAYIFGNDCIPTVTVCSDLPLDDPGSSGHVNLRAAAVLAASAERGVFSVYRNSDTSAVIHRGSRILRHKAYESDLSSTSHPYGKVILIAPENPKIVKDTRYSESEDEFIFEPEVLKKTSDIMLFSCYPGAIFPSPPRNCKAVILSSYHSGTLSTDTAELKRFAKLCKRRDITLFVDGIGIGSEYESMEAYRSLGIIRLPPLSSPTAMYMKLWLLISNGEKALTEMLYRPCGADIPPRQ
jgi:L-asparaginase